MEMKWLPIESAPKDAPWWLVWSAYYGHPVVVTNRQDNGTYWEGDWDFDVRATHWMPLPEPPTCES